MPNASELFKSNAIIVTGGTMDGVVVGGTTPANGTFALVGIGGVVVADFPLTAYQSVHDKGITVFGASTDSANSVQMYRSNGYGNIRCSGGSFDIRAETGILYFQSYASASSVRFFDATNPGNPTLDIYGYDSDASLKKHGRIQVATTGAFTVGSQAGEELVLYANGDIAKGITVKTTGSVELGGELGLVDSAQIRLGNSGASDSYISYVDSTGLTFYDNVYGATRTLVELANIVYDTTPELGGDLHAPYGIHFGSAAGNIHTPTGADPTLTINLANSAGSGDGTHNHHKINLTSASGTLTLTLDASVGFSAGGIKIKQHAATAVDITWAADGTHSILWHGTEPDWGSDTAGKKRVVSWFYDPDDDEISLSATEATT